MESAQGVANTQVKKSDLTRNETWIQAEAKKPVPTGGLTEAGLIQKRRLDKALNGSAVQ